VVKLAQLQRSRFLGGMTSCNSLVRGGNRARNRLDDLEPLLTLNAISDLEVRHSYNAL